MWGERAAGVLLVAGWAVFWLGAFTPPYLQWRAPLREYLEIIAGNRRAWLWINGCFVAGVTATVVGLAVLAGLLERGGSPTLSEVGQNLFLLGGVLWLASLAFRLSTTVAAAREAASSGSVPPFYESLSHWAGSLYSLYMVLAYLAIAAFGGAILRTELLPLWLGWASVAFGVAGAAGFIARNYGVPGAVVFEPPLMVHIMPGLMGVFLLV